jgi:hypothetical protein
MKKKIIAVLVALLLCSAMVFAQVSPTTIGGEIWNTIDDNTKTFIVLGYYIAMASTWDMMNDFNIAYTTSGDASGIKLTAAVKDWATFKPTIGDVVALLDVFYKNPNNVKKPVYLVIPMLYEKTWW